MRISDWSSDVCSSDLRSGLAVLIDHNSLRTDITGQRVAGNPEVRLTVGEVATDIEEMLGILRDGIRQLSAAASEGRNLPLQTRMILRLQASRKDRKSVV